MRRSIAVLLFFVVLIQPAFASEFKDGTVALTFDSKAIAKAVTDSGNSRGPALALLEDDTVLLGGGRSGGEILTL